MWRQMNIRFTISSERFRPTRELPLHSHMRTRITPIGLTRRAAERADLTTI